uniref:Uncharacterized protein n=1 Tax=Rhizophora mucronata TaxID=61149 RepID=A0A2P2J2B2_RHIMU
MESDVPKEEQVLCITQNSLQL